MKPTDGQKYILYILYANDTNDNNNTDDRPRTLYSRLRRTKWNISKSKNQFLVRLRVYFYPLGNKYQICPRFCRNSTPEHDRRGFWTLSIYIILSWNHYFSLIKSYRYDYLLPLLLWKLCILLDPRANRRRRTLHPSSFLACRLLLWVVTESRNPNGPNNGARTSPYG